MADVAELHDSMDAEVWAREFSRVAAKAASADEVLDPAPGGFLHSWFANALETGRSHGTEVVLGGEELPCEAEQATRLFKHLQVESCRATETDTQWVFFGGVILRFVIEDGGESRPSGRFFVRLVP